MNRDSGPEQRRICWPNPDATCLEGGCGYCNGYPWRNVSSIWRYAQRAGVLQNRAIGEKDAVTAYRYGELYRWGNADVRGV